MIPKQLLRAVVAAAIIPLMVEAATFEKVARFSQGSIPGDSGPCPAAFGGLVSSGGRVYWAAGSELWSTDGTADGTGVTRDLAPGLGMDEIAELVDVDGRLFFAAHTQSGIDLWVSDGTPLGTFLAHNYSSYRITNLTSTGSRVVYGGVFGYDGSVWGSDGSPAGTADLSAAGWTYAPWGLARAVGLDGKVAFVSRTKASLDTLSLFRSDGTVSGTTRVAPLGPLKAVRALVAFRSGIVVALGSEGTGLTLSRSELTSQGTAVFHDGPYHAVNQASFAEAGGTLYFVLSGRLWASQGITASTRPVTPEAGPAIGDLTAMGNMIFFAADDGVHGVELWSSDGTAAGTALVADINPGPASSAPLGVVAHGGRLYFSAATESAGREAWLSDGTADGTHEIADLCPGTCSGLPESTHATVVPLGDRVVFPAYDGDQGCRLWISDGTRARTRQLGDSPFPAPSGVVPGTVAQPALLPLNGVALFPSAPGSWSGLTRSDGTPEGTVPLALPKPGVPMAGFADTRSILGGSLLMRVDEEGFYGTEGATWRTDGSALGTWRVASYVMFAPSEPDGAGRVFFFRSDYSQQVAELWMSDGTPAGAKLITRVHEASGKVAALAERVVYVDRDQEHGRELWVTDGSPKGSHLLVDLHPGPVDTFGYDDRLPNRPLVLNGRALFGTVTTDGTPTGTEVLPDGLNVWRSRAARVGRLAVVDWEFGGGTGALWVTDGTATGTREIGDFMALDVRQSANAAVPPELLVFAADDGVHGLEPWRTDGTLEGTALLRDIVPGARSSDPAGFTYTNGRTWFTAGDAEHGYELWSSDGTEQGTVLEADVVEGPGSSSPWGLSAAGNLVLFGAREWLWAARGSPLPRLDVLPTRTCDAPGCPGIAQVGFVLSEPSPSAVQFAYETVPVTARPVEDYLPVTGSLTIPAGQAGPVWVAVSVMIDRKVEGEDRFAVHITGADGAVTGRAWAMAAIDDRRIFGGIHHRLPGSR